MEGYANGTTLQTSPNWAVGAGDDSNGTTLKGVFQDNRAWFHDTVNGLNVEKNFLLSSYSPGIGWSAITLVWEHTNLTDSAFDLFVSDGVNIAIWFTVNNDKVRVVEFPAITRRLKDSLGSEINGIGTHTYDIYIDETNEKFRIFFDGVEVFADTGFNSYYQSAGQIAGLGFVTQDIADNIDDYIHRIDCSWLPDITSSPYWTADIGDDKNGTTIDRSVAELNNKQWLLFRDNNNAGNIDVYRDIPFRIVNGYLKGVLYPVTSTNASDLWKLNLYDGVTKCIEWGIDPNDGKVYAYPGGVKTDSGLTMNLDDENEFRVFWNGNNLNSISVNGTRSINYANTANLTDGIDIARFTSETLGDELYVYLSELLMAKI